ncbi:MAG TPA: GTPase HflX [Candidatus Limnocylindria bacterium]|nr:GTPase HflX [Candidatus Limnocylindria bacterium]
MPELTGNLAGLRDSVKERLKSLYDLSAEPDELVSEEITSLLSELTALIRREIAVYLSRAGEVVKVAVGSGDSVALEDFSLRRSDRRLSRIRCVHTHPNGDPVLSDVDVSALEALRLDAMCALGVDAQGRITGATACFLSPGDTGTLSAGPMVEIPPRELGNPRWMDAILSNDLMDVAPDTLTQGAAQKAYLVSIDSLQSLQELQALAESAGAEVVGQTLQAKARPDPGTYVGSGKAAELALQIQAAGANLLIADDELGGLTRKRLEDVVGVETIDRTMLILDIFAQRAVSSEGKLQVALAQLNYRAARLVGLRESLSRQGGGIGTRRGPGESKLELDRRLIRRRIQFLQEELRELETRRETRRKSRASGDTPQVALVGYTNTGKSTLLNRLSGADVYVKDQLFATLDTVSRKITLREGDEFLLTDSVGFISKLPTDLVAAFRSTLDEALGADILCVVSDASNPQAAAQRQVVDDVLRDLGATGQPRIEVYNKWDAAVPGDVPPEAIRVSALTGEGLDELLGAITRILREREKTYELFVPFSRYQFLSELRRQGRVTAEEHGAEGTKVTVRLDAASAGRLQAINPEAFRMPRA